MTPPRLEVADAFQQHGQEFLSGWGNMLSPQQGKAFRDIGACRTAALGSTECPKRAVPTSTSGRFQPGRRLSHYAGIAPICCSSATLSNMDQCSTMRPFSTRLLSRPVNLTARPVGGIP